MTFQARLGDGPSLRFLSRPGVFSYGRFDAGARALVEAMQIEAGDRILDIGCGCGTNGIFAGLKSGPAGSVVFVDSNVRAVALSEHNARANGLRNFHATGSSAVEGLPAHRLTWFLPIRLIMPTEPSRSSLSSGRSSCCSQEADSIW